MSGGKEFIDEIDCAGPLAIRGATTSTGRMTTTDGIPSGTAKVIGGRAFASLVDSTPIVQAAALGVFDIGHNIPTDSLLAGTTLKIRAVVRITVNITGVVNCTAQITLGGALLIISGASQNNPVTGTRCVIEGELTFRDAPGGIVEASGVFSAIWSDQPTVVTIDPASGDAVPTFATNTALAIAVGLTPSGAGDTSGRYVLEQLNVQVI